MAIMVRKPVEDGCSMGQRHGRRTVIKTTSALARRTADWIARALPGLGIEGQVTKSIVENGKNQLHIDHLIPARGVTGKVAFRITSNVRVLPTVHFPNSEVRSEIHSASAARGRAIFCVRRDVDEVIAAISYHLPDRGPLELRVVAIREDPGQPGIWAESRHAVVMLKAYLHVFGEQLDRGADLIYEADTQAAKNEACGFLGFKRAKRSRGFRLSGRELLTQPKLGR
jgi:hypothetical protein